MSDDYKTILNRYRNPMFGVDERQMFADIHVLLDTVEELKRALLHEAARRVVEEAFEAFSGCDETAARQH